ncbi:MAG: ABC transporter permease subunit, partial [Xanthomonadales bacterium]|nr:ABC transporter permease subunit [Xanthomonadales bacterium]
GALARSGNGTGSGRSERFHRWRIIQDRVSRQLISLGGISVILAVVLILFYLAWVVFPLFLPAEAHWKSLGRKAAWAGSPAVFSAIEEQLEVGLRVDQRANAEFFRVEGLETMASEPLFDDEAGAVVAARADGSNLVAVADRSGRAVLFRHRYETDFSDGVEQRRIVPTLEFPYERAPQPLTEGLIPETLAISDTEQGLVLAASSGPRLFVRAGTKQVNFLTGEARVDFSARNAVLPARITGVAVSGNHRWLYAGDENGRLHVLDMNGLGTLQIVDIGPSPITRVSMLLGGISVLVGNRDGHIEQLFPVRDENNRYTVERIRGFEPLRSAVSTLQSEHRRKGFVAISDQGELGIYHSTAAQRVLAMTLDGGPPVAAAISPRANAMLVLQADGSAGLLDIENEHPEVSFSSLWRKVWYENYAEPAHIWQSSAATNEFEPKFSLTPLAFGTLKAALFAMLFAVPLALMGAAYTAYFMAPKLREMVKPTIEIMAALPTVILGFLAGLWFAPFIEDRLALILTLALILPAGSLLFAFGWSHYQGRLKQWVPEGWEPALLIPLLIGLGALSLWLVNPFQDLLFGGDLRTWLSQELGISYDQRNALVVGFAMGFAVIPTIFSMAEDAVFGVPKSLSDGSLALGATPWQTLVRVILPTASPGIFSALMIGLGRAVGETMIVLMATGNTPVMDWSIFEGMRTLAANIAVEMPESEVNSSHYRILFLAALVLFLFTFVVNTVAELIRQGLRERYSSL